MLYEEVIQKLFDAHAVGVKLGYEKTIQLSDALGSPHRSFPTVHIAGTNGKGSVTSKIAKVLQLSGYRTGLYISPHLTSFRERISINGVLISEDEVLKGMEKIFALAEGSPWTFFELTTLLAFHHFQNHEVDVAVIETGLGGKLDTTNIISPLLSVITSISFDHMAILGDTLEKIAEQKAGIIKPNTPVVIGPKADFQVIRERALSCNSELIAVANVPGDYDAENTLIAKEAVRVLSKQFTIPKEAQETGLKVLPPCRFEKIGNVIFDVAHNIAGFTRLFEALKEHFPNKKYRVVLGMSKDKDLKSCLAIAAKSASHLHFVSAASPRLATTDQLEEVLISLQSAHYSKEESVRSAIDRAKALAREDEILVICGSFFIMGDAKEAFGIYAPRDFLELNERWTVFFRS